MLPQFGVNNAVSHYVPTVAIVFLIWKSVVDDRCRNKGVIVHCGGRVVLDQVV